MWRNVVAAAVVMLAATAILSAQHTDHQLAGQPPPAQAVSEETIAACVAAQQQASRIADQAQARIEAARQTNSPAEMRASFDDLQAALGRIRGTLATCDALASAVAPGAAHQGHPMGTVQQSPPTPAMQPGSPVPAPGGAKPAAPAHPMDHSKMPMRTSPPAGKPAPPGAKPATPAAPMEHSKIPMGSETKTGGVPGTMKTADPKLPVMPAERVMDPACSKADTKTAPKATYQQKVYYFCSTKDRDEFLRDPAAYLKKRPRG